MKSVEGYKVAALTKSIKETKSQMWILQFRVKAGKYVGNQWLKCTRVVRN